MEVIQLDVEATSTHQTNRSSYEVKRRSSRDLNRNQPTKKNSPIVTIVKIFENTFEKIQRPGTTRHLHNVRLRLTV